MSKNYQNIGNVFIAAKEKGYTKDTAFNMVLICCSEQMHDAGYSSEQALMKTVELIKSSDDSKAVFSELLKMSGYNPDEN